MSGAFMSGVEHATRQSMERQKQHDDTMKELFGPTIDATIVWFEEYGPMIASVIVTIVICLAVFNAVVHCCVAVSMLKGGDMGRKIWKDQTQCRIFEMPGSGLKYLLTGPAWEVLSLLSFFFSNDSGGSLHVYAFQLFALGGGEMYNQVTFSEPPQPERHFLQVLCIESVFLIGMLCDKRVTLEFEKCFLAYAGCKGLGYLWAGAIVNLMKRLKLATFAVDQKAIAEREAKEKAEEEEAAKEAKEGEKKPAALSSSTSSEMSKSSDDSHVKKD